MVKIYPFKFLDAYTREDKDIFFGRSDEIGELYEMVFQTDLLLVYGASGTGKTSLIQCGLANRFESHDWLPLFIRRGSNLNESFEETLKKAGGDYADTDDQSLDWLDDDFSGNVAAAPTVKTLSPVARRLRAVYLKHFKPLYLIFDQFEELYVLGDKAEQEQFARTIRDILQVEQPVKIILSIREEYLGHLYEFERKVPELLRKKLRVEPMNLDKVKTVIRGAGNLHRGNLRLQAGEEDAISESIFEKIRGNENSLTIDLPYLQVFLDKLYLQTTGDELREADAVFTIAALEKMGDIGDVLRAFLDEQVLKIALQLEQKPETIWEILTPLVTLEGTKKPLSEFELLDKRNTLSPAIVGATLQAMVKSRILRFSEHDQRYEIAHDALAKQIAVKRSDEEIALLEVQRMITSQVAMKAEAREYFSEKQLGYIDTYIDKLKLGEIEQEWIVLSRAEVQRKKDLEAKLYQEQLIKKAVGLKNEMILFVSIASLFILMLLLLNSDFNRQKDIIEIEKQRYKDLIEEYYDLKAEAKKRGLIIE